jgi:hypothetical protein
MTDENFVVEAKFIWNVFAVFGISGGLQLSLFAIVDGISIGGEGSWKNHVVAECKLSWAWNVVLMAHINWHEKFLLGRYSVEVLSNEVTGL